LRVGFKVGIRLGFNVGFAVAGFGFVARSAPLTAVELVVVAPVTASASNIPNANQPNFFIVLPRFIVFIVAGIVPKGSQNVN
jgi:hypothetical protein